jgi:hypothetical protein
MTEPDILDLAIHALKELQSASWQKLGDPLLTTFERCELRNHLKQTDGELRRYLELMSERVRFQTPAAEDVGPCATGRGALVPGLNVAAK